MSDSKIFGMFSFPFSLSDGRSGRSFFPASQWSCVNIEQLLAAIEPQFQNNFWKMMTKQNVETVREAIFITDFVIITFTVDRFKEDTEHFYVKISNGFNNKIHPNAFTLSTEKFLHTMLTCKSDRFHESAFHQIIKDSSTASIEEGILNWIIRIYPNAKIPKYRVVVKYA